VLNQLHGHWLLFDALNVAISIITKLQDEHNLGTRVEPPFVCRKFDSKLKIFYAWMVIEAMNVLQPFLSFASTFEGDGTHNMLVFVQNFRYKSLQCITNFV
jgi:hypothetical protein